MGDPGWVSPMGTRKNPYRPRLKMMILPAIKTVFPVLEMLNFASFTIRLVKEARWSLSLRAPAFNGRKDTNTGLNRVTVNITLNPHTSHQHIFLHSSFYCLSF